MSGISDAVTLVGSATDDGLPAGVTLATKWTQVSGPAVASITSPAQLSTGVSFTAPGIYAFELSADDGLARRSDTMQVYVGQSTTVANPAGLMAWWPGNGTTEDVVSGVYGDPYGALGYNTGKVGAAFNVAANGLMVVPARAGIDVGAQAAGFTIEWWMNGTANGMLWAWTTSNTTEQLLLGYDGGNQFVRFYDVLGSGRYFDVDGIPRGVWSHVAITYDASTKRLKGYVNGILQGQKDTSASVFTTSGDLAVGGSLARGLKEWFVGQIDEVSLYSRPLSVTEITSLYGADAAGKAFYLINRKPQINANGSGAPVAGGASASLSATALDDGLPNPLAALTYLWSKVSGPGNVAFTAPTSLIATATFTAPGSYVLKIDASDSELTGTATVTVNVTSPPPSVAITSPVSGASFFVGQSVEFTATATDPDGTITKVEFYSGPALLGTSKLIIAEAVGLATYGSNAATKGPTTFTVANCAAQGHPAPLTHYAQVGFGASLWRPSPWFLTSCPSPTGIGSLRYQLTGNGGALFPLEGKGEVEVLG